MNSLISAGIDIGTTTTQLVITRLALENVMPGSHIPHICITNKRVLYIGHVHYTPFTSRQYIDGRALREIIQREYARAGFTPSQINTGAVIITGETAKKENAAEITHALAGFAGDFVVATAGPHLEGILAGKGSGALKISQDKNAKIINVDIGGGTANLAVFDRGEVQSTACLNIGGRLLEIDPLEHKVSYIAEPMQHILNDLNDPLKRGDKVDATRLMPIVRRMIEALDQVLLDEPLDGLARKLMMTDTLQGDLNYSGIVFSGGVGRYLYAPDGNWFIHGDIGPLLAAALHDSRTLQTVKLLPASETLHATVLGAGAHSLTVSGSTTCLDSKCLPLRNLPVITLATGEKSSGKAWLEYRKRYSAEESVAYHLPRLAKASFKAIQELAEKLIFLYREFPQKPLVILAEQDIGKVLGQALRELDNSLSLVCLDEIVAREGDYIDMARALPGQEVVPVVIKTLVFSC